MYRNCFLCYLPVGYECLDLGGVLERGRLLLQLDSHRKDASNGDRFNPTIGDSNVKCQKESQWSFICIFAFIPGAPLTYTIRFCTIK